MNSTLKQSKLLNKTLYLYVEPIISCKGFKRSHTPKSESKLKVLNEEESSKDEHIWVSPPHPVSNLRLKIFPSSKHLTKEEIHFYEKSRETQEWNQQYWESHNRDFETSKKLYMEKVTKEKKLDSKICPSPEDMATFYKEFLNKTYQKHISYNWTWYKKNFELLYLSAVAQVSKIRKFITEKVKDVP